MFDSSVMSRTASSSLVDNPDSLQTSCLDYICQNLEAIAVAASEDTSTSSHASPTAPWSSTSFGNPSLSLAVESAEDTKPSPPTSGWTRPYTRSQATLEGRRQTSGWLASKQTRTGHAPQPLSFASRDMFIHTDLSEQLLARICERGRMTDEVMNLFQSCQTRLRKVHLTEASKLTTRSLRVLRGHQITHLTTIGLSKATVTDLIGCLGDWTLQNLQSLNVAKSTFVDHCKITVVVALSKLQHLHTLNVSSTEFTKTSLEMIVDDLPRLENLDISCTKVSDISCLRKCKHRLKSLSLYGLRFPPESSALADVLEVLQDLSELRHLDVSENPESDTVLQLFTSQVSIRAERIVERSQSWPNLISLDISGNNNISDHVLQEFLTSHKDTLRFLGLALSDTCKLDLLTSPDHPTYNANLTVTGSGNEAQVLEALRRYKTRPCYVQKSLYHLFRLTQNYSTPRRDMIEIVTGCARTYKTVFNIQMAATACLFNLTKGELGKILHPRILSDTVKVNLNAMEEFPQHQQLQKNVLLTICSDRILQDVSFDHFRCAKLVMDCLCKWQDLSMNRMSVAICSILAAKISTKETSELGSHANYMEKLLQMVKERLESMEIDIILKFTLSALWNLTDESPRTCCVFLQEGGMDLFLQVLDAFPGEISIETKVLGLLNNIAEVKELRFNLMVDSFINLLSKLMHSKHIDVSYFAAGIVAYLASSGPWTATTLSKEEMTEDLCRVVSSWKTPKDEMVAYRSFKPFFPLMAVDQSYAVQLWATWAVHHVCTKNPQRYCSMLKEQGGSEVILNLLKSADPKTRVHALAERIIRELVIKGFLPTSVFANGQLPHRRGDEDQTDDPADFLMSEEDIVALSGL